MKDMNLGPQEFLIFIPESQEQERAKQPFRTPQKPTGPLDAENRVHPGNKRAVADKRNQFLRLVRKPFLVPKKEIYDYHRCAHHVVIEIVLEKTELS